MKVLLVDDNRELRDTTRELLEVLGHRVSVAASGEEALAETADDELELLVTDLAMPGIDGVELAARLLDGRPDLAVLLISSETESPRLRGRLDRGDVAFVAKPFSAAALKEGIEAAIAARAVRRDPAAASSRSSGGAPSRPAAPGLPQLSPQPGSGDRRAIGSRISAAASALMVAAVVAATILILEPGPPELPRLPAAAAVRGGGIELLEPVGPIAELPPAFRWRPVAAADRYRMTVRRIDDGIVWQGDVVPGDDVAEPRLELTAELAGRLLPAVAYTWNVAAFDGAGDRIAWSGRIRFRVLPRAGAAAAG